MEKNKLTNKGKLLSIQQGLGLATSGFNSKLPINKLIINPIERIIPYLRYFLDIKKAIATTIHIAPLLPSAVILGIIKSKKLHCKLLCIQCNIAKSIFCIVSNIISPYFNYYFAKLICVERSGTSSFTSSKLSSNFSVEETIYLQSVKNERFSFWYFLW